MAIKINPVNAMEAMRAMALKGWEWGAILMVVRVAGVMMGVLLAATTWM